ncbi:MAG TPA: Hsp70 family protein [Streptosporangiaceae bacterium]|nr:Hsp70 family protein [Streptosporangiaceae bacterium]
MNSTVRVVGIDLGTTNSVVSFVDESGEAHAIAGRDGERIIPSVVWFPRDDESRVEVGELARSQALIDPDHVAMLFKRGMGKTTFLDSRKPFVARGKEWRPEELSSLVLKKMVQMASDHLGYEVTDVVVTVPAYFGEAERSATRQAGEMIGLTVHALPAEPMAAAVAHGLDGNTAARRFLVFDLGGGTFDVTVLQRHSDGQLEAVSHHGDRRLGGADFDRLIVAGMADQAMRAHGIVLDADPVDLAEAYAKAEQVKKDLSSRDRAQAALIVGGKRMTFELTRAEFTGMLAEHLESVELAVETCLDNADLRPSDMDAVLMVGGSSRIPAFQELLRGYFGRDPQFSRNLDEDVARGAALIGALKTGTAAPASALAALPPPVDRSSHAIGVNALDDHDNEGNFVVLPANAPIPTEPPAEQTFGLHQDGQTEIDVVVNEGDEFDLRFVDRLASATGKLDSPKPKGYPITVKMALDGDGILHVTVYDGETGGLITKLDVQREGAMTNQEITAAAAALDDVMVL